MWFNKDYLPLPENPVTRAYLFKSCFGNNTPTEGEYHELLPALGVRTTPAEQQRSE